MTPEQIETLTILQTVFERSESAAFEAKEWETASLKPLGVYITECDAFAAALRAALDDAKLLWRAEMFTAGPGLCTGAPERELITDEMDEDDRRRYEATVHIHDCDRSKWTLYIVGCELRSDGNLVAYLRENGEEMLFPTPQAAMAFYQENYPKWHARAKEIGVPAMLKELEGR